MTRSKMPNAAYSKRYAQGSEKTIINQDFKTLTRIIKYPERNLYPKNVTEKEKAAFHESGHAAICLKYNLNIEKVIIEFDQRSGYTGIVETPDMLFSSKAFEIYKQTKTFSLAIIQYYSGIISEAFYSGNYDWRKAQDDLCQASIIQESHSNCGHKIDLWTTAERIVIRNWSLINYLANELIEKQKLNLEEMNKIINQDFAIMLPPALKEWS